MNQYLKLIIFSVGIFVCYFYYGVILEKIASQLYGNCPQEKFKCFLALVYVQCLMNWIYAHLLLRTFMKQGEDVTSNFYMLSAAITYLLGTVCSNKALQWVNYPTQVIGKSGKPIPVMILGVLLGRKSYPIQKYFFVLLVVTGVALFMYQDGKSSKNQRAFGIGEILLIIALALDGLTGAVEERMKTEYNTKSLHMMVGLNKWAIIFIGATVAYTGEAVEFVGFVQRHPSLMWEISSICLASCQGQLFIFLMIEHFGPLPCSIVTTTRKFFTLFGSVLIFGHSLSLRQWVASFLVFAGLYLDNFYGRGRTGPPYHQPVPTEPQAGEPNIQNRVSS